MNLLFPFFFVLFVVFSMTRQFVCLFLPGSQSIRLSGSLALWRGQKIVSDISAEQNNTFFFVYIQSRPPL